LSTPRHRHTLNVRGCEVCSPWTRLQGCGGARVGRGALTSPCWGRSARVSGASAAGRLWRGLLLRGLVRGTPPSLGMRCLDGGGGACSIGCCCRLFSRLATALELRMSSWRSMRPVIERLSVHKLSHLLDLLPRASHLQGRRRPCPDRLRSLQGLRDMR
jgi:hypothetical protein